MKRLDLQSQPVVEDTSFGKGICLLADKAVGTDPVSHELVLDEFCRAFAIITDSGYVISMFPDAWKADYLSLAIYMCVKKVAKYSSIRHRTGLSSMAFTLLPSYTPLWCSDESAQTIRKKKLAEFGIDPEKFVEATQCGNVSFTSFRQTDLPVLQT